MLLLIVYFTSLAWKRSHQREVPPNDINSLLCEMTFQRKGVLGTPSSSYSS
jgi:hypothetical protein